MLENLWTNLTTLTSQYGWTIAYIAIIALLGSWVLLLVFRQLRALRTRRRDRVNKRKLGRENVTSGPEGHKKTTRTAALESIENQFSVSKKLLLPLLVIFVLFFILLPFIGNIPAAGISLIVAGFTVILGIASRPWIENIIAGLVLSYSKALNIGDTVLIQDHYGTIEDINFTYTILKIWDWRRFVIPNQVMLREDFVNYTLKEDFYWAKINLWVGHDADLDQVERICVQEAAKSAYRYREENPEFWISDLKPEGVEILMTSWASGPRDGWYLRHDMRKRIMLAFQKYGIPVPYTRNRIEVLHQEKDRRCQDDES
jgi:small-conductance mechanosensitive channel